VLDSLDPLEALVWAGVCHTQGWASIEAPGYGKGYVVADSWWLDLAAAFDFLRRERGMMTVLLAHSTIERVDDPRAASYTSYQLRLHKRARGIVQEAMGERRGQRRHGVSAQAASYPGRHREGPERRLQRQEQRQAHQAVRQRGRRGQDEWSTTIVRTTADHA
jgi:hypothetical protein